MSLSLPSSNSSLRQLFTVESLVNWRDNLISFTMAKNSAVDFLKADKSAKTINFICMRSNGELWLVEFGPNGR